MELSIVVPCYNESDNIFLFYETVKKTFQHTSITYECIFVNDGSKDDTYHRLKCLKEEYKDDHICVIDFSRNFGKDAAMFAGMVESVGQYVVIVDADLQQNPEYILRMIAYMEEDESLDSVAAYQKARKEGFLLTKFKNRFYFLINKISQTEFVNGASDFRLMNRVMVEAILSLTEKNRFTKGIFSWVGFHTKYIPYTVEARANGKSNWSFWKLLKYALEGFASFTTMPLRIATFFGITFSILAFVYMLIVIVQKLFFSIPIDGYATIICLILLIGGIMLFCLGIMGEYIARTYMETKNRPIYIQRHKLDYKDESNQK